MTYRTPAPLMLSWVAACLGAGTGIVATERLIGGITADVDRIVARLPNGHRRHVVLRRWTNVEPWTDGLVERECTALLALAGTGLAGAGWAEMRIETPRLIAADPTGEQAGVRCLLMTELPGQVLLAPTDLDHWLRQLARTQARIHGVAVDLTARSDGWFDPQADFGWISDAGLRRDVLAAASANRPSIQDVLVHGDYQHFNVLWQGTELSGVVDWTMAGVGPRGVDVGHCRLNLAVLFSADAAESYLRHYEDVCGMTVDPIDDLRSLLCWDPGWLEFIPAQIHGRAQVDLTSMPDRVTDTIRRSLARLG